MNALAGLPASQNGVVGGDGQSVLDFGANALRLGTGQVDLVDERDDLQIGVHGHHGVGHRLSLHALSGIHHQHGPLARRQAAGDLVGEVHMPRRVDEVEMVELAVIGDVVHAHGLALDGNAALALDVHAVEQLGLHIAMGHGTRHLQDAVGDGRLAMVDMGDNAEVADVRRICSHAS